MTPSSNIRLSQHGGFRVVIEDGEHIACANCGLTMHADLWLDEEERQIRRSRS